MKDPVITLTHSEMLEAGFVGVQRNAEALAKGWKNTDGNGDNCFWQQHIEGALAELALAKHLGIAWRGKGSPDLPDVGPYEVRNTPYSGGSLWLKKRDPDNRVFWLVTGINGYYRIRGCILASEGKQEKYWTNPTGKDRWGYFVPQSDLRPYDDYDF